MSMYYSLIQHFGIQQSAIINETASMQDNGEPVTLIWTDPCPRQAKVLTNLENRGELSFVVQTTDVSYKHKKLF